ncbi:amino acid deaminase [Microbacterium sp.]|uniref:amino acid deaminase n=1 Tax=Microbacterium sp. TaxID=51671 RepID=UPI003F9D1AF0
MIERLDTALADNDPADVLSMFDWLGPAIDRDADADRFAAWGRSTVIDENIGDPVLPRTTFDALHARARLEADWPVGNAGLLHVYGYLLSTTPTPFGLKRDRWLGGDLALACGLAPDHFVPWTGRRTLLDRASAAARILIDASPSRQQQVGDATTVIAIAERARASAIGYAIEMPEHGRLLITMFPVDDAAAVLSGIDAEAPRLRWNAVL